MLLKSELEPRFEGSEEVSLEAPEGGFGSQNLDCMNLFVRCSEPRMWAVVEAAAANRLVVLPKMIGCSQRRALEIR